MLEIIIAAVGIMTASLVGILFIHKTAASFLEKRLPLLVAFSTGVFLVTATLLAVEVFHVIDSYLEALLFIILGYGLAAALQYILPESHHHHGEECLHKNSAKKVIVGDAIHNITDGIILVPAFMVSTGLGITVALSIFIHEALQEISEFFVLRRAGYSVKKALLINFVVSSTIFVGVGIAWFSLSSEVLEGVLLAVSSGFFIHVLLHDLLPHTKQAGRQLKHAIVLLILGSLTMLSVNAALGETHTHEHGHEEEAGFHVDEKNIVHELEEPAHDEHSPEETPHEADHSHDDLIKDAHTH
jgi:zinc and cadmium transporter